MKSRYLAQSFYETQLAEYMPPISSSGPQLEEFSFTVSQAPQYNSGFVVIDFDNVSKRDLIQFHRRTGTLLFYYRKNRDLLGNGSGVQGHNQGASCKINDVSQWINHAFNNIDDFGMITKWGSSTTNDQNIIMVFGGTISVNGVQRIVSDTPLTLSDGTSKIYFDYSDGQIKSGVSYPSSCMRLGTVVVTSGLVSSIVEEREVTAPVYFSTTYFDISSTITIKDGVIGTANIAANAITTAKIADGAVTTGKVADAAITTAKIADNAITSAKIAYGAVGTSEIAEDSINGGKIIDRSVDSSKIEIGGVQTENIDNLSVTTAKIADLNITNGKIADGAVTTSKITDSSITTDKIANLSVTNGKLSVSSVSTDKIIDGSVTTTKIADDAITSNKILNLSIGSGKLADGAVTTSKIGDASVTSVKIATGGVQSSNILDAAVTTNKLATSSISTEKIQGGAITNDKIAALSVTTDKIVDNAITTQKIADQQVTDGKIAVNTITGGRLAENTIPTSKIQDLAVENGKIASGSITNDKIQNLTITGGKLANGTITGDRIANQTITMDKLSSEITGLSLKVGLDSSDTGAGYLYEKVGAGSGVLFNEITDAGKRKLQISFNAGTLLTYTGSEGLNMVGQDARIGKEKGTGGTNGQITTDREIISNGKGILVSGNGGKLAAGLASGDTLHSSIQGKSSAFAVTEATTNTTLTSEHSTIIIKADSLVFQLPDVNTCIGRTYEFVKQSKNYDVVKFRVLDQALIYVDGSQDVDYTDISPTNRLYNSIGSYGNHFKIIAVQGMWYFVNIGDSFDAFADNLSISNAQSTSSATTNVTAGVLTTTVIPNSTVQKIETGTSGSTNSTRKKLNINGLNGIAVTVTDNPGQDRADISVDGATLQTAINTKASTSYVDSGLVLKANDSQVLHNTGNETSTGLKKFENIGVQSEANGDTDIVIEKANSTAWWSKMRLSFKRYRGTLASKVSTSVGDALGVISFSGWNGADKNNGSMQVTDNGSRGKMAVTGMDVEFDGITKFTSLGLMGNVDVDLTESYGPNLRVGGNDGNFAMRIRRADGGEIAAFRGNQEIIMSNGGFMVKENGKNVTLNENNTERNSIMAFRAKNSANAGGMHWVHYADSDGSIVGNKRYAIWGYPRDNTGAIAGFNQYWTIDHPENGSNFNDYNFRSSIYDVPKINYAATGANIQGYYWLGTTPEGSLTANPGSTAQMSNGTMWLKATGTGSTGWNKLGGGAIKLIDYFQGGQAIGGTILSMPSPVTGTISSLSISLFSLPTGGNFTVDIKKNGTSILSTPLSITTTEGLTNGLYTVNTGDSGKATITTTSVSVKDRIEAVVVTGTTLPGSDLFIQLTASL